MNDDATWKTWENDYQRAESDPSALAARIRSLRRRRWFGFAAIAVVFPLLIAKVAHQVVRRPDWDQAVFALVVVTVLLASGGGFFWFRRRVWSVKSMSLREMNDLLRKESQARLRDNRLSKLLLPAVLLGFSLLMTVRYARGEMTLEALAIKTLVVSGVMLAVGLALWVYGVRARKELALLETWREQFDGRGDGESNE